MGRPTAARSHSGVRGITYVHNELARVVDILPGLVWSALPDGRVEFVNRRWREYTGFDLGHPSAGSDSSRGSAAVARTLAIESWAESAVGAGAAATTLRRRVSLVRLPCVAGD